MSCMITFFYFVRSGQIAESSNRAFWDAGWYGRYWSSRAYSDMNVAHYFYFEPTRLDPSNAWDRYRAFSLRCLSTVLD